MDVFLTGFLKKLLVAVSILVIVIMCVTPSEGRALEHRRRHQRRTENMPLKLTKEPSTKRHRNVEVLKTVKISLNKILRRLKNTRRFVKVLKVLNDTTAYKNGNPSWLPKVNFVDVHYRNYSPGASLLKRKFTYLIPKMYKSLVEYEVILKLLLNVTCEYHDDSFARNKVIYKQEIQNTLDRLRNFITEVTDSLSKNKVPKPPFDKNRMKLDTFQMTVDSTQCLKEYHLAFRGYNNLLINWYCELKHLSQVSKSSNKTKDKRKVSRECEGYLMKLEMKRQERKLKNHGKN